MKKISLKDINYADVKQLSRDQLKKVMGGFAAASGSCKNSQGGCDFSANCRRSSGAAGKCGSNATVTCDCI